MNAANTFIFLTIILWGFWGFFSKLGVQRIGLQSSFWGAIAFVLIIVGGLFLSHQMTPLKMNFQGIAFGLLAGAFSAAGALLFYLLLSKNPPGFVVAVTALYPLVTLLLSVLFFKEPLSITKVIGFVLGLSALYLLNL